jgi:ABC-2 type transport system ATP-binding protein/lipopolysaccharide transport system ATP-binding protein
MEEFVSGSSVVILASHSLALVQQWCHRAIYLRRGVAEAIGPVEEIIAQYVAAA